MPSQLYVYLPPYASSETFRSCFSMRQWKYYVIVPLGLIECEQRRTLSG